MKGPLEETELQIFSRAGTALVLAILLAAPASASTKAGARQPPAQRTSAPTLDMYSLRARRRAAMILQLKLLELRKAHLDRVRKVIEKKLPLDCLFSD